MRISPANLRAVASLTNDHRFVRLMEDVAKAKGEALEAVLYAPLDELADARARLKAITDFSNAVTSAESEAKAMELNQSIANTGNPDRVT
jgi:hypothetical protein